MSATRLRPPDFQRASEVVREGIAAGDADLAVLAVANSRSLMHIETAAPAGRESEVAENSIFLLASISKPFMGVAVAQLVQEGRLLYSDSVARYVPEFGRQGKEKVTVWHLLTHTSGLSETASHPAWIAGAGPAGHLQAALDSPLEFVPGSAYQYCNPSFWVLAEIVTRVSGRDYKDYLQERICAPLGLSDTGFVLSEEQRRRLALVDIDPQVTGFTFDYFIPLALPAGGVCSTAAELTRFGQAMLKAVKGEKNPILSPAAARTITSLHTAGLVEAGGVRPATYGLGWAKAGLDAGLRAGGTGFGHGGATATLLWVEPERDLVFVFLTNVWKENRVGRLALNAVLGVM